MLTLARWMAWTLVAVLVFVTLAPIDLRPVMTESTNVERAAAYALVGFFFTLAYPRHKFAALILVLTVAGVLEAGQLLTETRHGRVSDFVVKALSAVIGAFSALVLLKLRPQATPSAPRG